MRAPPSCTVLHQACPQCRIPALRRQARQHTAHARFRGRGAHRLGLRPAGRSRRPTKRRHHPSPSPLTTTPHHHPSPSPLTISPYRRSSPSPLTITTRHHPLSALSSPPARHRCLIHARLPHRGPDRIGAVQRVALRNAVLRAARAIDGLLPRGHRRRHSQALPRVLCVGAGGDPSRDARGRPPFPRRHFRPTGASPRPPSSLDGTAGGPERQSAWYHERRTHCRSRLRSVGPQCDPPQVRDDVPE